MAGQFEPVLVEPETARRDLWTRFHEYRRLRHMERHPDDPMRPDVETEARMKRADPFEIVYLYEIAHEGRMVSWLRAFTARPGAPGYESNKHIFEVDGSVHPEHRRRGIGASWLPLVVELMDRHGSSVLTLDTDEPSGHAFLAWLGAEEKIRGAENRLDLTRVDWKMVERWIAEGARRSPKTRLEFHAGKLPEAMWADFARQRTLLLNSMPFDDLDHGDIVETPDWLAEQYAQMDIGNEMHHVVIAREPDGVMAGVTDMTWAPFRPTMIEQEFTGVLKEARGRGIGKWIKAAMLVHIREAHPSVRWVVTGNADSNAPMLAINRELGFEQFRVGSGYQISRDRLAQRAKGLART